MIKYQKNIIIFFGIILAILFLPQISLAADFYVAQESTGEDNGSDCLNAHSIVWFNTSSSWANLKQMDKIGPGDILHLCGVWVGTVNSTLLTIQASGTAGSTITIKFETDTILQAPYFSTNGAININGKDFIKIDGGINGIIQNTDNGSSDSGKIYHVSTTGINSNGASDIEISNLTIQNMFINTGGNISSATDSSGLLTRGILIDDNNGNYSNIKIHDNIIKNSRAGIWTNFEGIVVSNLEYYNNKLSDHAWQMVIGAGVNNSVAIGIDIHDNEMTDWNLWQYPTSAYHTDGLIIYSNAAINSSYSGKFYNNYVHGSLGAGSPSGYLGTGCGGQNFLIYNNLFKCENPDRGGSCMVVYNAGQCVGTQPVNTSFYNNTSIGAGFTKTTWEGLALKVARPGVYMTVKNNIFVDYFWPLYDINEDWSGFTGNGSTDYNIYYAYTHIIGNERYPSTPYYLDLNSFREPPYYQETHSLSFNPLFVSSSDFHLQSGSPTRDIGFSLTAYFQTDKEGVSRPQGSAWDIGAYEYIASAPSQDTTPPSAPTGLAVE